MKYIIFDKETEQPLMRLLNYVKDNPYITASKMSDGKYLVSYKTAINLR